MIFEKQVVNAYKSRMHTRCDDTETVFYYSADDFDGLQSEPFSFQSSAGHRLQGYLYHYSDPIEGRLIVFDHGFGGGHRAYMKEIERLCRHGYLVLAYDHTGCMESEGESPNGLAQSLCDLNDCITAVKEDVRLGGLELSVMGHSWGAFATMNVVALHPEINGIVAMCGFVSVKEMLNTFFAGPLKGYRKAVWALEQASNPRFSAFCATESLRSSDARALLIYSKDDPLCRLCHYELLKEALEARENVRLLLVEGKGHNPNYTKEAVGLLGEFGQARAGLLKKKRLTDAQKAAFRASFDWDRITEQDEAVWQEILSHLDGVCGSKKD